MSKTRIAIVFILLLSALGFILFGFSEKERDVAPVRPQDESAKKAPEFVLSNLDGKTVKLSDYKGKVVLVNFWATWCPPCRRELPDIGRIREEYKTKNFEVIGIILERRSPQIVQKVEEMREKFGLNYPMVWGNNEVVMAYGGINSIPHTFLIDKNGNVYTDYVGARPYEVFKRDIEAILN